MFKVRRNSPVQSSHLLTLNVVEKISEMSRLERDKQITYFDTHYVQFV